MVELRRVVIIAKLSLLSHLALPKEGHLEAAVYKMADITYPEMEHIVLKKYD